MMLDIGSPPPATWGLVTDDHQAIADEYASTDVTLRELGERYGVTHERIRQIIKKVDPNARQRRRERDAAKLEAREWAPVWARMKRALDENRVCPSCGGWVLRAREACSPECQAVMDRTCRRCGYSGPYTDFMYQDGVGRNVCNPCNAERVAEWNKNAHYPEPTVDEWTCPACQRTQPASAFARCTTNKTGLQTYCTECSSLMANRGWTVAEIAERHGVSYQRTRQEVPS